MVNHLLRMCLLLISLTAAVAAWGQADLRNSSRQSNDGNGHPARAGANGEHAEARGRPGDAQAEAMGSGSATRATAQNTPPARITRRDPFRPFTLNVRPTPQRRENLAPLERYELGQLKLVGVIWNNKEPKAMVEDPRGLGYVVHVGTPIGPSNGKVKAIRQNEITIEEFFVDLYGERKRREVGMRILAESVE